MWCRPSRRALIKPARRSLVRCWLMVATPTPVRSARAVTSWLPWAASHSTYSRAELLNSAKVLAADASWGAVGSACKGPRFTVSACRSFCCAMAASILVNSRRCNSPDRIILTLAQSSKCEQDCKQSGRKVQRLLQGSEEGRALVVHVVLLIACAV